MKQHYSQNVKYIFFLSILFTQNLFAQPTISSFSPTSGSIGTTVIITGTNFDATPSNNIVYFGAVSATVSAVTTTSLTVTVPAGATYQPITVTTNGLTAYSSQPFITTYTGGAGSLISTSFAGPTSYATATNPIFISTGDLNGDGKVDLVAVNQGV